jgi:hypothetical protein
MQSAGSHALAVSTWKARWSPGSSHTTLVDATPRLPGLKDYCRSSVDIWQGTGRPPADVAGIGGLLIRRLRGSRMVERRVREYGLYSRAADKLSSFRSRRSFGERRAARPRPHGVTSCGQWGSCPAAQRAKGSSTWPFRPARRDQFMTNGAQNRGLQRPRTGLSEGPPELLRHA